MIVLDFMGGFLAVGLGIAAVCFYLRKKVRRFSRDVFGNPDILEALTEIDSVADNSPRSLNGCDSLLMPKILQDFPDFDKTLAMTYIRDHLKKCFGENPGFTIHRIVIARYLPSAVQKTIIFQAAASWKDGNQTLQKRYDIHYTFLLSTADETMAANCPNCGGALGYGITVCPYCGSRVINVLGNTWQVTDTIES